jgi:3-oxoacyl-[acyl-carrier-protein] synthase III
MRTEVFLTRTAAYLPFAPVANEDIETVLGQIGGKPSRARRLVLRSNGIQSRHYAIDRATGEPALSNAQLTAAAIRLLGDVGQVDCLATGTSLPDQLMPNHAVMVHGELGWPRLEVVSCAGICLAGTAALKHAWLTLRAGEGRRAVATGSELASPILLARNFEAESEHRIAALEAHPEIAFEKDFLRWMLSDGACLCASTGSSCLPRRTSCRRACTRARRKTPTARCAGGSAIRPSNGPRSRSSR